MFFILLCKINVGFLGLLVWWERIKVDIGAFYFLLSCKYIVKIVFLGWGVFFYSVREFFDVIGNKF